MPWHLTTVPPGRVVGCTPWISIGVEIPLRHVAGGTSRNAPHRPAWHLGAGLWLLFEVAQPPAACGRAVNPLFVTFGLGSRDWPPDAAAFRCPVRATPGISLASADGMDQSAPSKDAKMHTNAMPGWLMLQSQPPGELVADGMFVGQIFRSDPVRNDLC